ncbi:type II secretion system F family protein [Vibrio cholerae]|nr:type II secretion system F family protein [Vibrio cholerae]
MTGLLVSLLVLAAAVVLHLPSVRRRRPHRERGSPADATGIRDAPLILDLMAALLTAGASVELALRSVADACEPPIGSSLRRVHAARLLGATWDAAWDFGLAVPRGAPVQRHGRRRGRGSVRDRESRLTDIRSGLRFATSTGAPSAALLHAHAAQLRRRHNREIERRAAALGVQLVLPLGLCSLPAFVCLGVVPVVLGLLPSL